MSFFYNTLITLIYAIHVMSYIRSNKLRNNNLGTYSSSIHSVILGSVE